MVCKSLGGTLATKVEKQFMLLCLQRINRDKFEEIKGNVYHGLVKSKFDTISDCLNCKMKFKRHKLGVGIF